MRRFSKWISVSGSKAPASTGDGTLIRADDIVMPDGWTRHLFNDPVTGRRRDPTPPSGITAGPPAAPPAFYPSPRTDGDWAGLDVVWGPNNGTTDDPRDIAAERWDTVRTIYLDDREPPAGTPHTINGYSVGRFEGDDLVIDTTHITAGWQLPGRGPPHSAGLEVTERYRVAEDGRLEVTYMVVDPMTFTAPVTWQRFNRPADLQYLNPYDCQPSPGSGYSWEQG